MSHVPTLLKSDRSVFDKILPVDDNVNDTSAFQDGGGNIHSWQRTRNSLFLFITERQLEALIFFQNLLKKWAFIRAWASIRIFMTY